MFSFCYTHNVFYYKNHPAADYCPCILRTILTPFLKINRVHRLNSPYTIDRPSDWHPSDYGGTTRRVDRWASNGVAAHSDAWLAEAVAALAGKTESLVGGAFDDKDSALLQRFPSVSACRASSLFWWMDDNSCFQAALLSASGSQLVESSLGSSYPACRRLCIEVWDHLCLCTLWPVQ